MTKQISQIWAGMNECAKQPYRDAHLAAQEGRKKEREQLLLQSGQVCFLNYLFKFSMLSTCAEMKCGSALGQDVMTPEFIAAIEYQAMHEHTVFLNFVMCNLLLLSRISNHLNPSWCVSHACKEAA